jgi:O6-methylguanine-DNA--protein-cysteine methyltransferase
MSAAAKNPLAILVPTHRICPANGKEAGHSGATRAAKVRAALRQLERKHL